VSVFPSGNHLVRFPVQVQGWRTDPGRPVTVRLTDTGNVRVWRSRGPWQATRDLRHGCQIMRCCRAIFCRKRIRYRIVVRHPPMTRPIHKPSAGVAVIQASRMARGMPTAQEPATAMSSGPLASCIPLSAPPAADCTPSKNNRHAATGSNLAAAATLPGSLLPSTHLATCIGSVMRAATNKALMAVASWIAVQPACLAVFAHPPCSDKRWTGWLNTADEALRERAAAVC